MTNWDQFATEEVIAICRRLDGNKIRETSLNRSISEGLPPTSSDGSHHHVGGTAAASKETLGWRQAFRDPFAFLSRRGLVIGMGLLAFSGIAWAFGLLRFMVPNVVLEVPTKFKVGFPQDLATGEVNTRYKPQHGVWIVRDRYRGQSQIYALRAVCTHLGCIPNWLDSEQSFQCPCHGSVFSKDGINVEGPAPRPLERYAIRIADDGQLEIDTSRTFQEELGQWSDRSSFVSV
jgi:nitrite reductase/ring-hydroxylating ferredoxin subunit